jgi:hypothetical protein
MVVNVVKDHTKFKVWQISILFVPYFQEHKIVVLLLLLLFFTWIGPRHDAVPPGSTICNDFKWHLYLISSGPSFLLQALETTDVLHLLLYQQIHCMNICLAILSCELEGKNSIFCTVLLALSRYTRYMTKKWVYFIYLYSL